MTYKEALTKSRGKRIVGAVVAAIALLSAAVSVMKMLYFRLDNGTSLGSAMAYPFKDLVAHVYENTRFLDVFWSHSPTPNPSLLADPENLKFALVYVAIFIGAALFASGNKLAIRLRKIDERIENQLIEESIRGEHARTREEIRAAAEIPNSSIFAQFHQLYLAPIVTAVIGGLLLKLMGV